MDIHSAATTTATMTEPTTNPLIQLISSSDWTSALGMVESEPEHTKVWTVHPGFYGDDKMSELLPIHVACTMRDVPMEFMNALIVANPDSVKAKESGYGRLPLHLAVRSRLSLEIVHLLIQTFPKGASEADAISRLPLHYACSNNSSVELIHSLLDACPEGTKVQDNRGGLPLHIAANVGATEPVLRALIDSYPEAVLLRTNAGSTPRTCAMQGNNLNKTHIIIMLKKEEKALEDTPFFIALKQKEGEQKPTTATTEQHEEEHKIHTTGVFV